MVKYYYTKTGKLAQCSNFLPAKEEDCDICKQHLSALASNYPLKGLVHHNFKRHLLSGKHWRHFQTYTFPFNK